MRFLHEERKVLHYDVKLRNVMINLNKKTGKAEAYLGDFGLSRHDASEDCAKHQEVARSEDQPSTSKFLEREIPTMSGAAPEGIQLESIDVESSHVASSAQCPTTSSNDRGISGNEAAQESHHAVNVAAGEGGEKKNVDNLRKAMDRKNFSGTRYFAAPEVVGLQLNF